MNQHRLHIDGPPVLLEPNAAQIIAVTLHELATTCLLMALSGQFQTPARLSAIGPKRTKSDFGPGRFVLLTRSGQSETLPAAAEVTSMAPSVTPNRTGVRIHMRWRIHARCRIDRIFFNHHWRRRYNYGPANHDGSRLLDNDRGRSPVHVRDPAHSLELRYSEVPADRRPLPARQELVRLLHPRSLYAWTLFPCLSPCAQQTREPIVRSMNGCSAVPF